MLSFTTIVASSLLVILLAMQFSSFDEDYVATKLIPNLWSQINTLHKQNVISIVRLAQFGLLYTLRQIYVIILHPLYDAYNTRLTERTNFVNKYGQWAIITGDIHAEIAKEYSRQLIGFGMNILIVNKPTSSNTRGEDDDNENQLIEELKIIMSDADGDIFRDSDDDENDENELRVQHVSLSCDEDANDDTKEAFMSRIGDITTNGSIGVVINISSSSSESQRSATDLLMNILETVMPYMLFRRTGAIINVSIGEDINAAAGAKENAWIPSAIGQANSSFSTQLLRSMYYEYNMQSMDCLSVSIPTSNTIEDEFIVRGSFQMLGKDSELRMNFCFFVRILHLIFGDKY